MGTSLISLLKEGRTDGNRHVDFDVVFFQDRLVDFILVSRLEVEAQVTVLDSHCHATEWLFRVVYPSLGLLDKLRSYANRAKIEFKTISLSWLAQIQVRHAQVWHDD